ncbi:MAG: hypothetical protein KIG33_02285, partial [Oscillospiraceae bacterium]|nr:hypothetical protein [Oscillospiraceae bacterium]
FTHIGFFAQCRAELPCVRSVIKCYCITNAQHQFSILRNGETAHIITTLFRNPAASLMMQAEVITALTAQPSISLY